jgi:hypothetical protein
VIVDTPPPPPRQVIVHSRPGYVFVRGYWEMRGTTWVWVEGRWVRDRPGKVYLQGRWIGRGSRYHWVSPQWRAAGHSYVRVRGPQIREERRVRRRRP